ncbi:DUF6586 family protein [uncultured Oceanicoccus sp.]|uniref:DUF6586 family protein n=1 Tax=uncultured Oceanicoccus sp. TaxID=1706381 RepID=UPI0030DA6ACB
MANAQRPVVNQRLYFVGLHIEWLAEQLANQMIAKTVLEQSLGESVLFHLIKTYQAYLAEIAAAYTVPLTDFTNAKQLLELLEVEGRQSSEALELYELEAADSWLNKLQRQYHSIGPVDRSGTGSQNSQIVAISNSDNRNTLDLESIKHYWQQLTAIIDNQRERLEEW